MTDTIEVCPACSTSRIYRRKPAMFDTDRSGDTEYVCEMCGKNFDDPAERESRASGNVQNGTSKALLEADPEDYPR